VTDQGRSGGNEAAGRGMGFARTALTPRLLFFIGFLLIALFLYHEVLGYALVGHDSYPIILTARIESAADLAGTFTEELMDGRYTQGHFYRPALNLSFALDHLLFNLKPWGYHLTDLLILAAVAFLIALLPGRRGKGTIAAAGTAAALLFLVHPVHLNVLPVPARRGDTLSLFFLLAALHSLHLHGGTRRWAPALFALLAVSAKESGLIAPLLIFAAVFFGDGRRAGGRFAGAVRAAALPLAAVLLFALARHLVIGGVGGHGEVTVRGVTADAWRILPEFGRLTLYPFPFLAGLVPGIAARSAIAILLALSTLILFRDERTRRQALFAWTWMLLGWAVHGLSRSISPWYAIHTVVPFTFLAGLITGEGIAALRRRRSLPVGAAAVVATAILLSLGAVNLRGAPPFTFHPEWSDATRKTERYLVHLMKKIGEAEEGERIDAPGLPFMSRYRPGSPIVLVASLADYTVQAWAELVIPERKIRVAYERSSPPPPAPDEILVVARVER